MVSAKPYASWQRADIANGYFCFAHDPHLIFYLFTDSNIDIIGVPHQSMDIGVYFS